MINRFKQNNHSNHFKIYFIFCFLITQTFVSSFSTSSSTSSSILSTNLISNVQFTNDIYIGYISENVAPTSVDPSSSSSSSSSSSWPNEASSNRQNRNINTQESNVTKSIYVRFVDRLKPAVHFRLSHSKCENIKLNHLNIELTSDFDYESLDLFQLDHETFNCFSVNTRNQSESECFCFLKVSLKDDSTRSRLNREAKDVYLMQLKIKHSSSSNSHKRREPQRGMDIEQQVEIANKHIASLKVNILDDNDLEPMFDPSEYNILLEQFNQEQEKSEPFLEPKVLPAFSVISQVTAIDPDLSQNGFVRFFLHEKTNECNRFFGINWVTGEIYLKQSLQQIFDQLPLDQNEFEFNLEVKAVDYGLKHQIINTLLKTNSISNSRARKTLFSNSFLKHRREREESQEENNDFVSDSIEYKLISLAAQSPPAQSSSSYLNAASLESAYVNIRLIRNAKQLLEHVAKQVQFKRLSEMKHIDQELNEQISFNLNPNRIPFAVVQFPALFKDTVGKKLKHFLNMNNFFNDSMRFYLNKLITKSNNTSFLVSIEIDSNFELMNPQIYNKDRSISNSIKYCLNQKKTWCYNMIDFEFDIGQDLIESLHSACHFNLYISESNKTKTSLTLDPIDSKSALFQVKYEFTSRYETANSMCDIYLKKKFAQMFQLEYSFVKSSTQESYTIDVKSGLVKLKTQTNILHHLIPTQNIEVEANLIVKMTQFKSNKLFNQRLTVRLEPKMNSWSISTLLSNGSVAGLVKNHHVKLYNLINNKVVYKFASSKQTNDYELLYCANKSEDSIDEIEIIPQRQCPFKLSQSSLIFEENDSINKSKFNQIFLVIRSNGLANPIDHLVYHNMILQNNQMRANLNEQIECSINMKKWDKTISNEMLLKKPLKLARLNSKHSVQSQHHIEIDVLNAPMDNQCFQLKDDVVLLLCQILPSHANLEHLSNSFPKHTLNITLFNNINRQVEHKLVNISFKLIDSVTKGQVYSNPKCIQVNERDEFHIEPLNEENVKQVVQEDSQKQIQLFNELSSNHSNQVSNTFVSTLFESASNKRLNVTYLLNGSLSLHEDSLIWKIDCDPSKLCIYKLIEQDHKHNELFTVENGLLKSFVRLDFSLSDVIKQAKKSFAYSLRIQVNSFDFVQSFSYEMDIDLYFVIADLTLISELPEVNLDQYEYSIQVDQSQLTQRSTSNRDLLIFNGFQMHLLSDHFDGTLKPSDIYNISYSVQQIDSMFYDYDLPFYMDLNGHLFYQIDSDSTLASSLFEFQVLINFKFIYNSQSTFNLIADFRVNIESIKQAREVSFDLSELKQQTSKSIDVTATIDLSLPITSADLFSFVLNCPLIGFLKLSNVQMSKFHLEKPVFKLILPEIKSRNEEAISSEQNPNRKISSRARKYSVKSKSKRGYLKDYSLDEENNEQFQEEIVDIYETNQIMQTSSSNVSKEETTNDEQQMELSLLNECFFSHLELDPATGALYFNLAQTANKSNSADHVHFYTKIAKLINFYYYDRGFMSKLIKIDAIAYNKLERETVSAFVNLVFKRPPQTSHLIREQFTNEDEMSTKNKNKFLVNSNNLLNLFYNGDEFSIRLDVQENAVTWLDDEFVDENSLLNLRKYFESKLDHRQSLIYMNLINNLRYFLIDSTSDDRLLSNGYFKIDDNLNGILLTKLPIQFDYEVSQSYLARVMIVQYLNQEQPNADLTGQSRNDKVSSQEEDLVFDLPKQEEKFVYWMDLHINVVNVIDEPFQCSQPIYYLNINENQPKNKKLFTIEIEDYEKDARSTSSVYSAQIINTEETQGFFTVNGLDLQAGARKLDREAQARHEIDIKVTESFGKHEQSNSSSAEARFALCKIVIQLNDINDKRPIINELELTIYNKLDSNLIEKMKVPVANGIAIDQDQISQITYSIVSVRILGDNVNRRSYLEENKELSDLFRINETTGFVYASRIEMPCVECTIQLVYKANDEGRLKSRASRKSSIKFYVRQLPLSLFKINSELDDIYSQHDEQIDAKLALSSESSVRTFEFQTTSNVVVLNVSETLKLGEKVFQIKTKSAINSNVDASSSVASIVYYTLLETGNTNQTFYMSNHDGSLYLIKPLDYETMQAFNLTVLVTNWIGQIDYFHIQINVVDLNDNYPMFTAIVYTLNETLKVHGSSESSSKNKEQIVPIAQAYDLDLLDSNQLTFKLEDCFYTSTNILLKKPFIATNGINPSTNHLNYPLCSKQFVDLVWTSKNPSSATNQTIKLKLNTQRFNDYFQNSSDFFINRNDQDRAIVHFHLDLSVKDSSLTKSSMCRVHLNLELRRVGSDEEPAPQQQQQQQQRLVFTRRDLNKRQSNTVKHKAQRVDYGFRSENYFVQLDTLNQLSKGTELIRLNDEFVWSPSTQHNFTSFRPFDLEFYFEKNPHNDFFAIEPHFGLVYVKKTIQQLNEHLIELDIGCRPKWTELNQHSQRNSNLFRTAKLIVAISNKFISNRISEEELVNRPIWMSNSYLTALINENEPIGTYLKVANRTGQLNLVELLIDSKVLRDLVDLTRTEPVYSFWIENEHQHDFEIDAPYIRTRKEFDYEQAKAFELKLKCCIINADSFGLRQTSPLCFKQTKMLKVDVLNRNDNTPTIHSAQRELDLTLSQLIRSMSLFRFGIEDLDNPSDFRIDYELSQVLIKVNECDLTELSFHVNSFNLFQTDTNSFVLKLSDVGFDGLVTLKTLVSSSCYVRFELVCQVNDGVHLTRTSFFLNTYINDTVSSLLSIRDSLMAPIIHSIELSENMHVNESNEYLINMDTLLFNYLKVNLFNFKLNEDTIDMKGQFVYTLKNYEDLFWLDRASSQLNLRTQVNLDREQRESYELFIELYLNESNENSNLLKQKHLIPTTIRINVKLVDQNDNKPQFVHPPEVIYTKQAREDINQPDLFFYNQTVRIDDLMRSNETQPILVLVARDSDSGENALVFYHLNCSADLKGLFHVASKNGHLFLSSKAKRAHVESVLEKYKLPNEANFKVSLQVIAQDNGSPRSLQSILNIELTIRSDAMGLYFKQSFYRFELIESIELRKVIGYVNSAEYFTNSSEPIVYSIVDGNYMDTFDIDYTTGALLTRAHLDFEANSSYFLTIQAYNSFANDQYANASVRIDLIDANDNAPRFDQYEYQVDIDENVSKMSALFRLNASDLDEANTRNSRIRFKLVNELDNFYVNELTGWVYNKISFDFEQLTQPTFHLKIVAYDLGVDSLQTSCLLTIRIRNLNDHVPKFERSVYSAQIQIEQADIPIDSTSSDNSSVILNVLLDNSTQNAFANSLQFVSKVDAKDADFDRLQYAILKQVDLSHDHSIASINMFKIDAQSGIVYLDLYKYQLLSKLLAYQKMSSEKSRYELQLKVCDSLYCAFTRLNVQIKSTHAHELTTVPKFEKNFVRFNLNLAELSSNHQVTLSNLSSNLDQSTHGAGKLKFQIELEPSVANEMLNIFTIEQEELLQMNVKMVKRLNAQHKPSLVYQLPVSVCAASTMLCDQMLVFVNISNVHSESSARTNKSGAEKIGFAYNYWSVTLQQETVHSPADPSADYSEDEYDYYYIDDIYEPKDRFYFEIKTSNELNKESKYEFEMANCIYSSLNVNYTNETLQTQIRKLLQTNKQIRLSQSHLKSLFSLNKFNGVLSSRKIINSLLPGVYLFNIKLKLNAKWIDSMRFKLTILPANDLLTVTSKYLYNHFKFDKEFYKFQIVDSNRVKLINKHDYYKQMNTNRLSKLPKLSNYSISYKLISSNRNPIHQLLAINEQTGAITYTNSTLDENELKSLLNKNEELVAYVLAKAQLESNNSLEYMCELSFSFKQMDERHESIVHRTDTHQVDSLIQFGKSLYKFKLEQQKLNSNVQVFRFIAWTDHLDDLFHVKYSLVDESNSFKIDSRTGQLKSVRQLDKNEYKLNISACLYAQCTNSLMIIDVLQAKSFPAVFAKALYSGNVQEDALPGTILTTVGLDSSRYGESSSKVDYFIINGDVFNQFAISSDGKVYTRSLIDRERQSFYSLDILAFDGKYKSLAKIHINVLDVADNRPVCMDNYVRLGLSENLPIGQTVHKLNVSSSDQSFKWKFELIEDDEENRVAFESNLIPFTMVDNELKVNADLDFELKQSYVFFVRVKNVMEAATSSAHRMTSCLVKFEIDLIDQNDNAPKFSKTNYTTSLLENSPQGTILTPKIEAIDLDSREFGIIRYSLLNGHDLFKIDSKSAMITVNTDKLDRESVGNWFNLTIRAANRFDVFTDAQLFITLIDVNDNLPQFDQSEYFVSIEENMPIGFLIINVQAQDSDANSTIYYHLLDDSTNVFALNKLTGDITVNATLDYEVKRQYQLRILATESDSVEAVGSIAKLVVDLIDTNDNYPQFDEKTPTRLEIAENTPINTTLLVISAFDLDKSERNSHLMYSLNEEAWDFFAIDRDTGRLYNKVVFDYEITPRTYNLTVELSDTGLPNQLKNTTKLTISIKDINDNRPQFLRVNQTVIINEKYPLGQSIAKLQVNDLDTLNEGGAPFTFNIMNQFKLSSNQSEFLPISSPLFNINANGSLILIDKPMSNQTYIVQLRCYDSGPSEPLYSDSFITVKITDELNNEPQMSDSVVDIITVGSNEFDSDSIAKIYENQPIFELKAFDLDKQDELFFELFDLNATTQHFQVNQMNGELKAQRELMKSDSYALRASVTDKKFITESNVLVNVQNVKSSCLTNSLFVRFDIEHHTIEFAQLNAFLKRFKEVIARLLHTRTQRQKLNVHILGLRVDESDEFDSTGTNVEILFAVYKPNESCLNAKQISKVLNKRRPLLTRRMKTSFGEQQQQQQKVKIKLIDITYNNECLFGPLKSVCTTNAEIQNCKLKFTGYNKQMCEENAAINHTALNRCLLLPKYDWLCDEFFQTTSTHRPSTSWHESSAELVEEPQTQEVKKKIVISCKEPHNPCLNNGVCKQIKVASLNSSHNGNVKSRLTCLCANGFKGKFCEEDVNECDLDYQQRVQKQNDLSKTHLPCAANAQCINTYGSFRCNCSEAQASLCYNTAHYSASVLRTNELYVESDEPGDDNDYEYDEENTQIKTIFGQISARTIRHALLGLFAGICVILVLLSLAAGVVCRMNMNKKRRSMSRGRFKRREEHVVTSIIESTPATTSNASEAFSSSSTSSPGSYNKKLDTASKSVKKPATRNFVRNKQRSSMTASLLSNDTTTEQQVSTRRGKASNFRYKINNLLFGAASNRKTTNTTLMEEDEYLRNSNKILTSSSQGGTSSIYESTYESSSPASTPTNNTYGTLKKKQIKLDLSVVESSCLLEKDNDDYLDSAEKEQSIKLLTLNSNKNKEKQQMRSDNDADDEEELKSEQKKLLDMNSSLVVRVVDTQVVKAERELVAESPLYSSFQLNKFNTVSSSSKTSRLNMNESIKFSTLIKPPPSKVSKSSTPQTLKPISVNIQQKQQKTERERDEEEEARSVYDTPTNKKLANSNKTPNGVNSNQTQATTKTTTFQSNNDQLNDSINTENCSQGFYWDITDWTTGLATSESHNNNKHLNVSVFTPHRQLANTNSQSTPTPALHSINSNSNYSPIYSRVFKSKLEVGNMKSEIELDHNDDDEEGEEMLPMLDFKSNADLTSLATVAAETTAAIDEIDNEDKAFEFRNYVPNNFMYLVNADETFESNSDEQQQQQQSMPANTSMSNKIDQEQQHYFMPKY